MKKFWKKGWYIITFCAFVRPSIETLFLSNPFEVMYNFYYYQINSFLVYSKYMAKDVNFRINWFGWWKCLFETVHFFKSLFGHRLYHLNPVRFWFSDTFFPLLLEMVALLLAKLTIFTVGSSSFKGVWKVSGSEWSRKDSSACESFLKVFPLTFNNYTSTSWLCNIVRIL